MPETVRSDPPPSVSGGDPGAPAPSTDGRAEQEADGHGGSSVLRFLAELPVLVLVAFGLALLLKAFLIQAFYIPSESMVPTLEVGDRVMVNKLAYTLGEPHRGDVVVFTRPGMENPDASIIERVRDNVTSGFGTAPADNRDLIKRIIGLPGETIAVEDGAVTVDGVALPESLATEGGYLGGLDMPDFGPVTVPEGEYFMMGDNRPNSADSRSVLGTVPGENIVGEAFVRIWPFTRFSLFGGPDYGAAAASDAAAVAS